MNPTSGEHPHKGGAAPGGGARKAFVFYTNWYDDVATSLSLEQQQEFLLLIVRYASHGEEPSERTTPIVRSMFGLIKNAIDADLKKYEQVCERRRKRQENNAQKTPLKQPKPADAPNLDNEDFRRDSVILNTQDSTPDTQDTALNTQDSTPDTQHPTLTEQKKGEGEAVAGTPMTAPTREEVENFWREHRYRSSAREFYAYYSERGWKNAHGEPLRRWVIAANFWEEKFVKTIIPMKRREAEEQRKTLRADNELIAQDERAQQRADRKTEVAQRQARAVTPQLAKHMYQRARMLAPSEEAAMLLLRRASEDPEMHKRLTEGYR